MSWQRRIPFKVDVAGVIQIMGLSLYSRPEAAFRELIQNAHDAVIRRRRQDLEYKGRIDILLHPESQTIEIIDDGIGLNATEAEQYLGTLGIGATGLLKGAHPSQPRQEGNTGEGLIGQFGIGLFSAFMLADELTVESRRIDESEGIRWQAGIGDEIELSSCTRESPGTAVRLKLKPECVELADSPQTVEEIIKEYADFLSVPIHLNGSDKRTNLAQAAWFDPSTEMETLTLELETYFDETPLNVIPVRISKPIEVVGALYVTPQRTPGFSGISVVTATVRRMVVSHRIQNLLPGWSTFLRGVLEIPDATPTTSREDLVRDQNLRDVAIALDREIRKYFEDLAARHPEQMEAVLTWHRYSWAGAALLDEKLRSFLRKTYRFQTSQGALTFDEILSRSGSDPLFETDFDSVIWFQTDRRQERWINELFLNYSTPCVHTTRSFEESLLAAMACDVGNHVDVRVASAGSKGFSNAVLGIQETEDAEPEWQSFLEETGAKIYLADFREDLPVMAFLNERHELLNTFEELKLQGTVPGGFQRLIDNYFVNGEKIRNEVLLNRRHPLISQALSQVTGTPLAGVLRLLVIHALESAGASIPRKARACQIDDLEWIAEALRTRPRQTDTAE